MSSHESQVTFRKKVDAKKVEEDLKTYRPYVGSSVFNFETGKHGKVSGISVVKGNIFFRVEEVGNVG